MAWNGVTTFVDSTQDAADIMEPLQAAARSLETARRSNSDDALTSAFGELRALGVDVSSDDVAVIAADAKKRLAAATALFFAKRDAARVLLTGTTDEFKAEDYVGGGSTGLPRRYVAPGLRHVTRILGEYDQKMSDDAIKDEEVGLANFQTCREEAMMVAAETGIEFVMQLVAVTLDGVADLNNRTPLLAEPGNLKGLVKGVINPGDIVSSSRWYRHRPQLESDFALLVVLTRLKTLERLGVLPDGLPEDLADIYLTSTTVASYLGIFFHVRPRDTLRYGASEGTLVAGVCPIVMWRALGSGDAWKRLDRGSTSMEDKNYPSFSGADFATAPSVRSYGVLGTTVERIWGPQTERDLKNWEGRETERKARLDARRATLVEDALAEAAGGASKPFIVKEDGAIRALQIGLMGTGYSTNVRIHHDPSLEEPLDALAAGGAEFVLTTGGRAFVGRVDLVLLPVGTNWNSERFSNAQPDGLAPELKLARKVLVLEWFLKDRASYDGDDILGNAALRFREQSAVYLRTGTMRGGPAHGQPLFRVKAVLKSLEIRRFKARLLGHKSTVRRWMTSQGLEPPVTGLTWPSSCIEQARAVCADVNASADERRVARAILDDDAETTRVREVRDLDPDAAEEDGYADDVEQLQAHAAFLRSLEPGGEEAAPAAPPSFRLDRRRWRLPRGEREWKEEKQKDIDWEALKKKALQVPTPPAPYWSPEDVVGLESDDEEDDPGDELDVDVGVPSFF